jgi:hypothetical protein
MLYLIQHIAHTIKILKTDCINKHLSNKHTQFLIVDRGEIVLNGLKKIKNNTRQDIRGFD